MASSSSTEVPVGSEVNYHRLDSMDPRVLRRLKIWVKDPVVFCIEACNWKPHWYQEAMLRDDSLFMAADCSRQIGKSASIAHKAIHHAFTTPKACVVIIAPGQRQARLLYNKIVEAINESKLIKSSVEGKIKMEETKFKNGSMIVNLPSGDEGENLRGYTITLLIADESAFIPDAVFVAVEQGLSSSGGQQIRISTPKGRHNEFYRVFYPPDTEGFPLGKDGEMVNGHAQIGYWSCHHYDYTVALNVLKPNGKPQLSPLHVEIQKNKLPAWQFKSEYLAAFIEDLESYFKGEHIDAMFNNRFGKFPEPPIDDTAGTIFMGIDIAKSRDFTAVAIGRRLDVNPNTGAALHNPHVQIMALEYWHSATIEENYPKFVSLVDIWQPHTIWFDKTAIGERPYEELRHNFGLPVEGVHFTQTIKVGAFGTLNTLMSTPGEIAGWESRIQSYVDGEAMKQFRNLIYELGVVKSGRTGRVRLADNIKIYASHGHDDIPVSVALLTMCVSNAAITAPLELMLKPQVMARDAKVRGITHGFYEDPMNRNPVLGFGERDRRGRQRHSKKVFW